MDILNQLKAMADQVEVVDMRNESTEVSFESNRLKSSRVEETMGTAVRVVKDGRLGFTASSDEKAAARLVANAIESAAYGDKVPIQFPKPQTAPQVKTYDPAITDLPVARLVEIGQQIIDQLLPIEPDARINVGLTRGVQQLHLCNQTGTEVSFKTSPLSIYVELTSIKGDDILILFDISGTTVWQQDYMTFVRRLSEKLELAKKVTTLRSGHMPVIFSPFGMLVLAIPLMMGIDGKNVYQRTSPMAGKIGEKLFDEKISLIDDATIDGKFGSAPYDDEGVAHRRNVLVERGVLKSFIYDLKTAAQSGVESSGNGSRGLFNPPYPSPTNLIIQAGATPLAEMLADIDEGLLVENVMGLGQGNVLSGAFSNPVALGFKIEKGEIVGRVKNVSIAGNIYDLLKDVGEVSRETQWVYNNFKLPYMLLPDMNVVSKE